MKLESQVVSLELAQKLKELGVKHESYFFWFDLEQELYPRCCKGWVYKKEYMVSAFTVAELGEMLPDYTKSYRTQGGSWVIDVDLIELTHKVKNTFIYADTEADARALMLIYLIKNNLYTPLNKN